jgi:predicted methyltransferase
MLGLKALENFLNQHLDYDQYRKFFEQDLTQILREHLEDQTEDIAQALAHKCARNEPDAVDKVNQIFTGTYQHMDNILESARARKAKELAQEYARRKPGAIKLIHKLLAHTGSSIHAIMSEALAEDLDNIERIDRLTTIAETRRNAMLREIDQRRSVFGETLRRQVQDVEGEFEVIEKPPPEAKSAA